MSYIALSSTKTFCEGALGGLTAKVPCALAMQRLQHLRTTPRRKRSVRTDFAELSMPLVIAAFLRSNLKASQIDGSQLVQSILLSWKIILPHGLMLAFSYDEHVVWHLVN